MQSPYQSTPPRQQASSSLRTPSQHDLINAGCSNVRVVVRIRPFNTEEQRRGCKPTVYCLEESAVQQPPPDSPTGSITSVDSQSTTNSRQSFTLRGRRVLSKLRPFQHRRGKSNSTASSTVSIEPTPIINNSAKKRNVFAVTDDEATKQNGKYPKICCAANRQFEFDAVYGPAVTQEELYNHSFGESLAANLLEGYNTTIIAFGMTGAGKSYTMSDKDGVIYHSVHDIFHEKTAHTEKQVTVQMSCVEIYNEDLRDLLVDGEDSSSLKLRDNGDSVEVTGLHVVSVESLSEVRELLDFAQCRRTTGCTRLNERSSRSHAIYTLTVTTNNAVTAKLTLVDLAGSERIKETGVVGSQRKESIHINKELFVLGKVIASLQDRNCHVPYRDSKLTRLLRESLGGTSHPGRPKRINHLVGALSSHSFFCRKLPDCLNRVRFLC